MRRALGPRRATRILYSTSSAQLSVGAFVLGCALALLSLAVGALHASGVAYVAAALLLALACVSTVTMAHLGTQYVGPMLFRRKALSRVVHPHAAAVRPYR